MVYSLGVALWKLLRTLMFGRSVVRAKDTVHLLNEWMQPIPGVSHRDRAKRRRLQSRDLQLKADWSTICQITGRNNCGTFHGVNFVDHSSCARCEAKRRVAPDLEPVRQHIPLDYSGITCFFCGARFGCVGKYRWRSTEALRVHAPTTSSSALP